MARLSVQGAELVVHLSLLERIGAFHGPLRVPLSSVVDVTPTSNAWGALRGLRAPGTGLPGVIALGTWRFRGEKDFVAVYRRPGIVVRLQHGEWSRLVISVRNPRQVCAQITDRAPITPPRPAALDQTLSSQHGQCALPIPARSSDRSHRQPRDTVSPPCHAGRSAIRRLPARECARALAARARR